MDAVTVLADVVADGVTDLVAGATVPVASEEDEAVAPQEDFNFVRNATLSKRELYDYLCAVANFSLFTLNS